MPQTIWNFGSVAITVDLIFGVCVYTEDGWVPFTEGTEDQKEWVRRQIMANPLEKTLLERAREELFGGASQ